MQEIKHPSTGKKVSRKKKVIARVKNITSKNNMIIIIVKMIVIRVLIIKATIITLA